MWSNEFLATEGVTIASIAVNTKNVMKPKRKQKKLRITEADFMLANRRAARMEEISEHGRPVSMRSALHKSKKVYDRKRLKRAGINSDDLSFFFGRQLITVIGRTFLCGNAPQTV